MPDGTKQVRSPATRPALTEAERKWVHEFTGKDPGAGGGAAPGMSVTHTARLPDVSLSPGLSAPLPPPMPNMRMPAAPDPDEDLIEVPLVTGSRSTASDPIREARAEFRTPAPHRFIRQADAPLGQQQLNVAETQTERMIQPHGVADDLSGKPVAMVRIGVSSHPRTVARMPRRHNAGYR
jgi:hypothetical protein